MKVMGYVPITRTELVLLKAKNPRLVQRRIMVHGPNGSYQRTAWVLPGDAGAEKPARAQFDLFDQGPEPEPEKQASRPLKRREKPKSLAEQLQDAEAAEQDARVTAEAVADLKAEWKIERDARARYEALQAYKQAHSGPKPGDAYKRYLVVYNTVNLDDQKVSDSIVRADDPAEMARFAMEHAKSLGEAVPSAFMEKLERIEQRVKPAGPFGGLPVKHLADFKYGAEAIPKNKWEDYKREGEALEVDGRTYVRYVGDGRALFWGETAVSGRFQVKLTPALKGKINKALEAVSSQDRSALSEERKAEIDRHFSDPKVIEGMIEWMDDYGTKDSDKERIKKALDRAGSSVHPFFSYLSGDTYGTAVGYLAHKLAGIVNHGNWHGVHYKKGEAVIELMEGLKRTAREKWGKEDGGFYTNQYLEGFEKQVDKVMAEVMDSAGKGSISRANDSAIASTYGEPKLDEEAVRQVRAFMDGPMKKSILELFSASLSKALHAKRGL